MVQIMSKGSQKGKTNLLLRIQISEFPIQFEHMIEHVHEWKSMSKVVIRYCVISICDFFNEFVDWELSTNLIDSKLTHNLSGDRNQGLIAIC